MAQKDAAVVVIRQETEDTQHTVINELLQSIHPKS